MRRCPTTRGKEGWNLDRATSGAVSVDGRGSVVNGEYECGHAGDSGVEGSMVRESRVFLDSAKSAEQVNQVGAGQQECTESNMRLKLWVIGVGQGLYTIS